MVAANSYHFLPGLMSPLTMLLVFFFLLFAALGAGFFESFNGIAPVSFTLMVSYKTKTALFLNIVMYILVQTLMTQTGFSCKTPLVMSALFAIQTDIPSAPDKKG